MAGRHTKQGLDYFPLDVDFFNDEKIEFVSARFGVKGEVIAIRLLCKVYRTGYFTEWNEDESTLLAKRAGDGITPSLVSDVVKELVRRGFFDETILNRFGILTSKGIQKRYATATTDRKETEIIQDIWLVDMPKNARFAISLPTNSISPPINPQSKVKESKVTPYGVVELWNSTCVSLPCVKKLTDSRKRKINTRLGEMGKTEEEQTQTIRALFERIQASDFLKGANKRGWTASFDWVFENDKNWVKITEGQYEKSEKQGYDPTKTVFS